MTMKITKIEEIKTVPKMEPIKHFKKGLNEAVNTASEGVGVGVVVGATTLIGFVLYNIFRDVINNK